MPRGLGSRVTRNARKILPRGDLQIGEGLVVAEFLVVLGKDVLDEPRLDQEGVDLALRLDVVDIPDFANEFGRSGFFRGRFEEVAPRTTAEVFRLPDVDDDAGGVLHEIDAGRVRK